MDSITHTLFGLALYGAFRKTDAPPSVKRSLFVAAVAGSHLPDSDVVINLTATGRIMEQMWHRGLTHSLFIAPFWAWLVWGVCRKIWNVRDSQIYWAALLAVLIHIASDAMNAWGTGLFEPFSGARVAFGTIPIVDVVIWGMFALGVLAHAGRTFLYPLRKSLPSHRIYRAVWVLIAVHVALQNAQGLMIYQQHKPRYDQLALAATFTPWHFRVIGKTDGRVDILQTTSWGSPRHEVTLYSSDDSELEPLFAKNPKAEVLYRWSPFVVVVDDDERLGIFDPRFYRNGRSFLYEYVDKAAFKNCCGPGKTPSSTNSQAVQGGTE